MKKSKKKKKQKPVEIELEDGKVLKNLSMENTFCENPKYEKVFEDYDEIYKEMPEA